MGNSKGKGRKGSAGKGNLEQGFLVPMPKKTGISYEIVSELLFERRKGKENLEPGQEYSFMDTFKVDSEAVTQIDTCVFANVKAVEGSSAPLKMCQDEVLVKSVKEKVVFGIFDGHGKDGHKVAKSCVFQLEEVLSGKKSKIAKNKKKLSAENAKGRPKVEEIHEDPCSFLVKTIHHLHETINCASDFQTKLNGSTVTLCSLSNKSVDLAWVGDSKAVLFISTKDDFSEMVAFNVTSKHDLRSKEEEDRIKSNSGVVGRGGNTFGNGKNGPPRVYKGFGNDRPGLNISKSVGDTMAHSVGVNCEADVFHLDIDQISTIANLRSVIPDSFNAPGVDDHTPAFKLRQAANPRSSRKKKDRSGLISTLGRRIARLSGKRKNRDGSDKSLKKTGSLLSLLSGTKRNRKASAPDANSVVEMDLGNEDNSHRASVDTNEECSRLSRNDTSKTAGNGDVQEVPLANENDPIKHAVLIAATDGVWDLFPKEDVANFLGLELRAHALSKERNLSRLVCLEAQIRWKRYLSDTEYGKADDISAVTAVLF